MKISARVVDWMPRLPSAWYHELTIAHSITSTSNTSRCKGPHFLCRATAAISFHLTARTAHLRVRREMLLSRVLLDMTKAHPCAVATSMPHRVVSALMLLAKPLPLAGSIIPNRSIRFQATVSPAANVLDSRKSRALGVSNLSLSRLPTTTAKHRSRRIRA